MESTLGPPVLGHLSHRKRLPPLQKVITQRSLAPVHPIDLETLETDSRDRGQRVVHRAHAILVSPGMWGRQAWPFGGHLMKHLAYAAIAAALVTPVPSLANVDHEIVVNSSPSLTQWSTGVGKMVTRNLRA